MAERVLEVNRFIYVSEKLSAELTGYQFSTAVEELLNSPEKEKLPGSNVRCVYAEFPGSKYGTRIASMVSLVDPEKVRNKISSSQNLDYSDVQLASINLVVGIQDRAQVLDSAGLEISLYADGNVWTRLHEPEFGDPKFFKFKSITQEEIDEVQCVRNILGISNEANDRFTLDQIVKLYKNELLEFGKCEEVPAAFIMYS